MSEEVRHPREIGIGLLVGFDDGGRLIMCARLHQVDTYLFGPVHADLVHALGLSTGDDYATLCFYDDDSFDLSCVTGGERAAALEVLARLRPSMTEYVRPYDPLWDFS